ncbi:type IV secretion protein Rhs [Pedobacter cryoconitis]|uniref:Type IV secretion protein Rhs n=1 Tax=Pedobacter cryoconitis TaxID=188932 RepID=A0A127VG83_9SPHI|nr:phage baseplate assembly protein V [Pedobacter cryoconitis]AMQ00345.1 type IV secretion protein Rhs [Pedobacter cryoconitis]
MENKVKVNISIEGTPITTFSSFNLNQRFNEHHTFELRFNQDQIELPGSLSLNRSKDFIGKNLAIEFGDIPGKENRFSGIITNVKIAQKHGFMGDIIVSGFSPTILLDRGPDLGSYLGKDLSAIISQATKEVPANDLQIQVNPSRKGPIDYLIQYRESDFDFINRLSAQYHEWFFYNGAALVFGKPDDFKAIELVYGRDLSSIQYGMQIAPLKYKKFAYNPKQDELLAANGEGQSSGPPDLAHAITASNSVYSKTYNQPLITRADNKMEIDSFVKNEQDSIKSGLVNIKCEGDNPQVCIGGIADISMSVRKLNDFSLEDFGKFLVTSVSHSIDGVGRYKNNFEAIPSDTERVPVNPLQNPQPDMQLANVIENNDPDGHGRIKVKFKWACDCNDVTEWLRVVTPDAGSSEKVSKNRGFVFIPEIGDQVVIAFEEGNIARPIVMGSVFHGKSGSGGSGSNNSKSLTSKSGHTIQLDDGAGITVKDKDQNFIVLDGAGKAHFETKESILIQCGESSILMDKAGTIIIKGKNILTLGENIGQSATASIGIGVGPKDATPTSGIGIEPTTLDIGTDTLSMSGKTEANLASPAKVTIGGQGETNVVSGTINLN